MEIIHIRDHVYCRYRFFSPIGMVNFVGVGVIGINIHLLKRAISYLFLDFSRCDTKVHDKWIVVSKTDVFGLRSVVLGCGLMQVSFVTYQFVIVAICDCVAICDWKCRNLWRVPRFVTEGVAICDNVKMCNLMTYSINLDKYVVLSSYMY